MRAILSHRSGGPETLQVGNIADPEVQPGKVLLRVRACGVNFPDTLIIEDRYQFRPERPFAPGAEVSGIVESVGSGVDSPQAGDRVMAMIGWGGMAEKVLVPAENCIPMPEAITFEEGAAFIITYGTSYHALKQRARLTCGETLLVLGAAGGVGLAAVELGAAMGARVIAAVSSEEKLAIALAHGAAHGVIYPRDPALAGGERALAQLFKEACGTKGCDVVYDAVGGAFSEAACRALSWGGRLLVVGFPAGIARLPLNLLLLKGAEAVGVFYGAFVEKEPRVNATNNAELSQLYELGKIRPLVSEVFALENAGDAIAALASRQSVGKLVVLPTRERAPARDDAGKG